MPTGRISKKSVDALACPEGQDRVFLWDDALAGFGVAAYPKGKKVFGELAGRDEVPSAITGV
jgi:hypothetical protein